jgi:hypothetical protein
MRIVQLWRTEGSAGIYPRDKPEALAIEPLHIKQPREKVNLLIDTMTL